MAYISFQPSDFMNTVLYTGTGSSLAVTGCGFQPNMTWIKCRDVTNGNFLYDTLRGATTAIMPNNSDGDATYSGKLIPSKETSTHRYARTHNNKIKSLPKKK